MAGVAPPGWVDRQRVVAGGAVLGVVLTVLACSGTWEPEFAAVPLPTGDHPRPGQIVAANAPADPTEDEVYEMHEELLVRDAYPSARDCGVCHPKHFEEWSVSSHAYAQMSPVFNALQGAVMHISAGTNADFCIRCHTPVGMALGEPPLLTNIERHPTSREGITCIACHRQPQAYGKVTGRLAVEPGPVTAPVYGPTGENRIIDELMEDGRAHADPEAPGRQIHAEARRFFQQTTSAFCGTCHDVKHVTGVRIEEAFSEWKMSPAAQRGVSCQDCHMGEEQGIFLGSEEENYPHGPAAVVGGEPTEPRKLTNHMIVGPDYSLVHPGLFPLHPRAIREEHEKDDPRADGLATIREWLEFDYEAGWGTNEFEDSIPFDHPFPERWEAIDDRYDARDIIEENLALLERAAEERRKLLRRGYHLGDIDVTRATDSELRFRVQVRNGTDGHNVPTGFDGERLVWLHVTVRDADGEVVMESGDLDPNGDVRDKKSLYVQHGEVPLDDQLFSLQGSFVIRMNRGGEREQILPVNFSFSPLVFYRPSREPSILTGRARVVRKHKRSIEPLGERWADYSVTGTDLGDNGPYEVDVELKAAMLPVNLVSETQNIGFDFNMSARDVADALVAGHQVLWSRQLTIDVSAER